MHLKTQRHQESFLFIALRRPAASDSYDFLHLVQTKVLKESVEKWEAKNFRNLLSLTIFRPTFFDRNCLVVNARRLTWILWKPWMLRNAQSTNWHVKMALSTFRYLQAWVRRSVALSSRSQLPCADFFRSF